MQFRKTIAKMVAEQSMTQAITQTEIEAAIMAIREGSPTLKQHTFDWKVVDNIKTLQL